MKKIAYFITLGFTALFLSSCCGLGGGCGGGIVSAGCEDDCTTERTSTKYKTVKRTIQPSAKGGKAGIPYTVTEQVAYEVTETIDTAERADQSTARLQDAAAPLARQFLSVQPLRMGQVSLTLAPFLP